MKTITELNAWIAVNVFCWRKFREEEYPHRDLWDEGEDGSRVWDEPNNYTQPAGAYELEAKILERSKCLSFKVRKNCIFVETELEEKVYRSYAATRAEAVMLLARKIEWK